MINMTKFYIIFFLSLFFQLANCYANEVWKAEIKANRADSNPHIFIGLDSIANSFKAAPEPPAYSCHMVLLSNDSYEELSLDIKKNDKKVYQWIISINPNGIGDFYTTSKMFWDKNEFGKGFYCLVDGYDGTGNVLIRDMKKQTSINITGKNKFYYYTIKYKLPDISDLISCLKILSGINTDINLNLIDVNENKKIELSDCIKIIKYLAELS